MRCVLQLQLWELRLAECLDVSAAVLQQLAFGGVLAGLVALDVSHVSSLQSEEVR